MSLLNTHIADDCCGSRLNAALLSGLLDDTDSWDCPDCGTEWQPRTIDGTLRHWEPRPAAVLFRI